MSKIVFFSLPGHGHTNPTLPVMQELVRRKNTVICYSLEEFRKKIEATGSVFRSYNPAYIFDGRISQNFGLFARKLLETTEKGLPDLMNDVRNEQPDCILHDTLAIWGRIIAKALHIPAVSFFTTIAFNNKISSRYPHISILLVAQTILNGHHSIRALHIYKRIVKTYRLNSDPIQDMLLTKEALNIVFTSSYFQPCSESFDKTFTFVGPSIESRKESADFLKKIDKTKKIIYIATGTVFNDNLHFYRICMNAFADSPYQVILSLGHRFSHIDVSPIPKNCIVKNHIPQLLVLQKADVFISHAGMNSISESLYYGVPLVLVPPMYEQQLNAVRVQELGAGIYVKRENISPESIKKAVDKIFHTRSFYTNAEKIKHTFQNAGGYKKAAEAIMNYVNRAKELKAE